MSETSTQVPLVEVSELKMHYPLVRSLGDWIRRRPMRAVKALDGVTFSIGRGKVLGLVGESGCGKSTTGLLLSLLERPSSGTYRFDGANPLTLRGAALRAFRRRTQVIFQDPYQTLDPRLTIEKALTEPLEVHKIGASRKERREIAAATMRQVGLPVAFLDRYPHQLSGGQRQRIAIARAVILKPDLIIADEPISMLDVSIRSSIMNLMLKLRTELGATFVFISHDLASARYMSDEIAVMYLGRVVEQGPADEVIESPKHPYTLLLLSAVPDPTPGAVRDVPTAFGEPPNPADAPSGCPFHPRCASAMPVCQQTMPQETIQNGHKVCCHLYTVSTVAASVSR